MKKILTITALLLSFAAAFAQSTNPLNYSGRMYVSSYEVLSTPRYVSYEDHAIISSDMTVPVTEITTLEADFEKGTLKSGKTEYSIKVKETKKYTLTDGSWVVVIYITTLDGTTRFEHIWREYGCTYLDNISKEEDGSIKIIRMNLSSSPKASSPDAALLQMLGGLGSY